MASHHHPHQPHLHWTHLPPACCCGGDSAPPCFQTHHPSPRLPPSPSDTLLQALAFQILQSSQFQHHSHYPSLRTQKLQSHYQFQPPNPQNQKRFREQELPQVVHHSTVSSLLSRIEALESSLPRLSGSHVPSRSLRHVAASTIQTHFRAFLVRRSRALGELQDLAIIKSRFESIQSSLCNEFYFDRNAISLELMDLLLHLDSIRGSDLMVKDSKKSLIRDLVQFLEQIDNFAVKKNRPPLKAMKNLRLGQNVSKSRVSNPKLKSYGNQKETIEELKSRVEKICERSRTFEHDGKDLNLKRFQFHHVGDDDDEEEEEEEEEESPRIIIKDNNQTRNLKVAKGHQIQHRVKKSVRFAENGNLSRVLGSKSPHEDDGVLDEKDSSDELVEDTCNEAVEIKEFSEVAEDDEEAHGNSGSPEVSDGEGNSRRKMTSGHGGSAFSAPLPLKMEKNADLMRNRKSLKILG